METANTVFVFGSNLAGRHGKGAALEARNNWGAIYGLGVGIQNWAYAIPTKDCNLKPLPLDIIRLYVGQFIIFADDYDFMFPYIQFKVANIGCGLAGYKPEQIAPMFRDAPDNCIFSEEFEEIICQEKEKYAIRLLNPD